MRPKEPTRVLGARVYGISDTYTTRGVSHYGLAIYIQRASYGKRRRIMETQIYFTMQKL
jgi:hypothetical protein